MLPTVLTPKLLAARNYWRRSRDRRNTLRDSVLLGFAFVVMAALYYGTTKALRFAEANETLAYIHPSTALGMALLFLFGMLIFSNVVSAFGALFLARDLDLLLSAPLTRFQFFWGKYVEVFLSSSWMAIIFGLPVLLAFGIGFGASAQFYLLALVTTLPFFAIPSAVAIIGATLFARVMSTNRTKEILFICALLFLLLLYFVVDLLAPGRSKVQELNQVLRLLALIEAPFVQWVPSFWSAAVLGELLAPQGKEIRWHLLTLYSSGVALIAIAFVTVRVLYLDAYTRSRSLTRGLVRGSKRAHHRLVRLFPALDSRYRALASKEYRAFTRDITQVLQLVMLLGIAGVYFYNFKTLHQLDGLPDDVRFWWRAFLAVVNIAIGNFIITAMCTRFVFPSVSLEGPSLWILQTSPLTFRELLKVKLWTWFLPIGAMAAGIFAIGSLSLNIETVLLVVNVFASVLAAYGIVALAVGMGAVFANLESEHSSQVAASFGSLIFMLSSVLLITLNLTPTTILLFLRSSISSPEQELLWLASVIANLLLLWMLNVRAARWALERGAQSLAVRFS